MKPASLNYTLRKEKCNFLTFLRGEFTLFYRYSKTSEYCKRTVNNFATDFFAHCYQEHWQNEIHYIVHLSTLLPKRNETFHAVFLLKKCVHVSMDGTTQPIAYSLYAICLVVILGNGSGLHNVPVVWLICLNRLLTNPVEVIVSTLIPGLPRSIPNADECHSKFWH